MLNNTIQTIALQADGKIIVGGEFFAYNGTSSTRIIRLNADGSHDPSFSAGTGFDFTVYDLKLYANGEKVLAGGRFSHHAFETGQAVQHARHHGCAAKRPRFTGSCGCQHLCTRYLNG